MLPRPHSLGFPLIKLLNTTHFHIFRVCFWKELDGIVRKVILGNPYPRSCLIPCQLCYSVPMKCQSSLKNQSTNVQYTRQQLDAESCPLLVTPPTLCYLQRFRPTSHRAIGSTEVLQHSVSWMINLSSLELLLWTVRYFLLYNVTKVFIVTS